MFDRFDSLQEPFWLNFTIAVSFRGGVGGGWGNYRFRGKLGVRFG